MEYRVWGHSRVTGDGRRRRGFRKRPFRSQLREPEAEGRGLAGRLPDGRCPGGRHPSPKIIPSQSSGLRFPFEFSVFPATRHLRIEALGQHAVLPYPLKVMAVSGWRLGTQSELLASVPFSPPLSPLRSPQLSPPCVWVSPCPRVTLPTCPLSYVSPAKATLSSPPY